MNDDVSPEFLAWMEAREVARRWRWLQRDGDNWPIPKFVLDEIERRERAWQEAKDGPA